MANTLTNVTPQLLAQGLLALRQNSIMPRLVNNSYSPMAAEKGASIDIPIPSAISAQEVTPAVTHATNVDVSPTKVTINLNQWYEARFQLSDKDMMEALDGHIPMQASEAVKALANNVDSYILGLYTGVYGLVGSPGTAPFATNLADAGSARKLLFDQLCPVDDRRVVLDTAAEANALVVPNILQAQQKGDQEAIVRGNIGRIMGMDWYMDQNVPTHDAGSAWVTGWTIATGGATAGNSTITLINSTATGTVSVGDVFTVSGDSQQYVVTAENSTVTATTNELLVFTPSLASTYASGAAITVVATHVANLVFHRDAFAFASRPLQRAADGLGAVISSAVDPISGLALRLEVSRQYKQTTFSYDILYGAKLVRPQYAVRLAG